MKYRWMTYRLLFALVMMVAPSACAYIPHDGGQLSSGDKAHFIGFSTAQSGQVQIQAQQPSNGQWVTLATATADSQPYTNSCPTIKGVVYQWSRQITVPGQYFSGNQVTLRTQQQVGESWVAMWMYDQAGWECLVSRYFQAAVGCGELDVWNVGIECSGDRHQITMHR